MKLGVFIPAYNEAATISEVLAKIPRSIAGIKEIKVFVIDDGSTDGTAEAAEAVLAPSFVLQQKIIRVKPNRGLANAFRVGLTAALADGADIIAHLDADGQYDPQELPKLVAPILASKADLVTGDRQIAKCAFLGPARQYGNMLGSWFLRVYAGVQVKDVSCGFRAYSRAAAQQLEVHSTHTYTHETLIEARYKNLRVVEVPITFKHRPLSRFNAAQRSIDKKPAPTAPNTGQLCLNAFNIYKNSTLTAPNSSRLTTGLHRHIYKCICEIFAAKARYSNKAIDL